MSKFWWLLLTVCVVAFLIATLLAMPNDDCHPSYGACITGPVTCSELGVRAFRVLGDDVYGLDRDQDGVACE